MQNFIDARLERLKYTEQYNIAASCLLRSKHCNAMHAYKLRYPESQHNSSHSMAAKHAYP